MIKIQRRLILLGALAFAVPGSAPTAGPAETSGGDIPKIERIGKQAEEPGFQPEWRFARDAANKNDFGRITAGATDGERVLPKIENVAAQSAKGLIICAPDVRLGPAILARARQRGMKLMSVDDQPVDAHGKPLDVAHLGISVRKIGDSVGEALHAEMTKRGRAAADTARILATGDELDTALRPTPPSSPV